MSLSPSPSSSPPHNLATNTHLHHFSIAFFSLSLVNLFLEEIPFDSIVGSELTGFLRKRVSEKEKEKLDYTLYVSFNFK